MLAVHGVYVCGVCVVWQLDMKKAVLEEEARPSMGSLCPPCVHTYTWYAPPPHIYI